MDKGAAGLVLRGVVSAAAAAVINNHTKRTHSKLVATLQTITIFLTNTKQWEEDHNIHLVLISLLTSNNNPMDNHHTCLPRSICNNHSSSINSRAIIIHSYHHNQE